MNNADRLPCPLVSMWSRQREELEGILQVGIRTSLGSLFPWLPACRVFLSPSYLSATLMLLQSEEIWNRILSCHLHCHHVGPATILSQIIAVSSLQSLSFSSCPFSVWCLHRTQSNPDKSQTMLCCSLAPGPSVAPWLTWSRRRGPSGLPRKSIHSNPLLAFLLRSTSII